MFTVTLDACVLVPITLTDILLRAAHRRIFAVRWSDRILDEAQRALVRRGLAEEAASRRFEGMRTAFPFAAVDAIPAMESLMTNDPKDRHVAATAIAAGAHTIVTFNLKDFPEEDLAPWDLQAIHPDTFLLDQLDLAPGAMMQALDDLVRAMHNPKRTHEEVLGRLHRIGLPEFADEARRHLPLS